MDGLFNYIRRNIKLSVKSVFYNMRQYAWFFCAIILIQVFVATMSLSAFNNNAVNHALLNEEYDSHVVLKNINTDQYLLLENDTSVRFERNRFFLITDVVQHGEADTVDLRYDVYIRFNFEPKESYEKFTRYFSEPLNQYNPKGNWTEYKTPLFQIEESERANTAYYTTFLVAAAALSALFLGSLYSTRTNYFKFTYGIFMSFGGGFKKIYATSFWEMMTIAVTSIIPSSIISYICARIIYAVTNVSFKADFRAYWYALLLSMAVSAVALFVPCKRISRKTPISNIVAQDNSNYVSSPHISFEFFNVNIPRKYELASLFRFRKYNLRLVLTGAFFAALFVWVSYFSILYGETLLADEPTLTVSFTDNTPVEDDEEEETIEDIETVETQSEETMIDSKGKETSAVPSDKREESSKSEEEQEPVVVLPNYYYTDQIDRAVRKIDGIEAIQRVMRVVAGDVNSMVLIDPSLVNDDEGLIEHTIEDSDNNNVNYLVTNSVYFSPFDERDTAYLERFDYDGDLSSTWTEDNTIIISDSVSNKTKYDFDVGDTILIGIPTRQKRAIPDHFYGEALLRRQLVAFEYEYTEFTIGAVIRNAPSDECLQIYMPSQSYLYYTGETDFVCRTVNVWVDDSLPTEEIDRIQGDIATIIKPYANGGVEANHARSDKEIEGSKNKFAIYSFTAVITLCIVPILWMFSQRMFYIKRREEFTILEAVGVTSNKIRGILLWDAYILGAITGLIYLIIAPIGTHYMLGIANSHFSMLGAIRYTKGMPIPAYLGGLAVVIACAFASTFFAYRSYVKKEIANYKINISTLNSEFKE